MSLGNLDKELLDKQLPKGGKVRKFRRSHKNSRDGCPNCRAKRVKCTEELPSCSNCVRRQLRCGYLDFSTDRLEHIRKKNEVMKRQLTGNVLNYENAQPTDFMPNNPKYHHNSQLEVDRESGSLAHLRIGNTDSNNSNPPPYMHTPPHMGQNFPSKKRKSVTVKKRSDLNPGLPRVRSVRDFRSVAYSNAVNHNLGKDKEDHSWTFPDSVFADSIFFSELDNLGLGKLDGTHELYFALSVELLTGGGSFPVHENLPQEVKREMLETTPRYSNTSVIPYITPMSNPIDASSPRDSNTKGRETRDESTLGKPLPNASYRRTVFPRRKIPERLRNVIMEKLVARVKSQNLSLKNVTNENLSVMPKPVWDESGAERFWISIIQQLSVLNLYFLYFINKGANILVRASSAVINGDIDISTLPNSTLTSSPSLPTTTVYPSSFFYTQNDLSMLVQKSYTSFDELIRTLRESINEYHEEYPAKMSLVSAWGCYFHVVSNIGTFCLMMSGTFTLLQKSFANNSHASDLSTALKREAQLLKFFYVTALYPDYTFALAQSLIDNFQNYKNFVQYLIDSYEAGQNFEPDLVRVLKDPLFRHDYHETDKFLDRLQNHFYPSFREIDSYYKSKCPQSLDNNTRFLSPTLTFDLAFEWFQVYRGDKTWLGRNVNPLKKTLYVFLNAIGKAMAHIFPSLKYVSFVDPCNVAFCKVGFSAPEFDPWNRPLYHSIAPMFMDFVKTIKFFENRLKICGYLANRTVKNGKFITKVTLAAPETWEHRDIINMSAEKLPLKEKQLKSMSNTVIQLSNYPFFDELLQEPSCAKLIEKEQERQRNALYNDPREFFQETGILNHDFDGSSIVDHYCELEVKKLEKVTVLIEELREINEYMNECQLEVTSAIHDASK